MKRPADSLVVAIDGVSGTDSGGSPLTIPAGTKLRADHWLARKCPDVFAPADLPDDEIAARRRALYAAAGAYEASDPATPTGRAW